MCKHIINIRTPAGDFDIHLLVVYTIAVAATLGRNDRFKMRFAITLISYKVDIQTLLDALGQAVKYVNKSVEFGFAFGYRAVYFGAQYQ